VLTIMAEMANVYAGAWLPRGAQHSTSASGRFRYVRYSKVNGF